MVRYKVVPPARGTDALFAVRDALPLVPGSVEDCCSRIRDRTDVPSRDAAREWLTFCQALGLAAETDRGYHRVREPPDREAIADAFGRNVFGVEEVLAAVAEADRPLTAAETFEAVRDVVPHWERSRQVDWEAVWRERIDRLLAWGVALGVVVESDEGYEPA